MYAYEYYSPLAFRAKLPQGRRKTVTSVRVLATFRDKFFLILPSSQIFEHVEDFIFIHIMSEPVLEKSKSTLSKGTSSSPQTWAEYKERLKVFGWQNGTSYKWYYFNLNC